MSTRDLQVGRRGRISIFQCLGWTLRQRGLVTHIILHSIPVPASLTAPHVCTDRRDIIYTVTKRVVGHIKEELTSSGRGSYRRWGQRQDS